MKQIRCENCGRVVIILGEGTRIMIGLEFPPVFSCPKCEVESKRDSSADTTVEKLKSIFGMK